MIHQSPGCKVPLTVSVSLQRKLLTLLIILSASPLLYTPLKRRCFFKVMTRSKKNPKHKDAFSNRPFIISSTGLSLNQMSKKPVQLLEVLLCLTKNVFLDAAKIAGLKNAPKHIVVAQGR